MKSRIAAWGLALLPAIGYAATMQEQLGTAIGGALGGVLGSQTGKGSGRIPGIAVGTALGAFIGNRVGKYLDEQEKRRVAEATVQAAETGKPQTVKTRTGATVTTSVTSPEASPTQPIAAPAPVVQTAEASVRECRTVSQTIVLRDGTSEVENVTVCKGANGWEPVS